MYPGIIGYHIMTENSPKGTNWEGRRSRRIGSKEGDIFEYECEYTEDIYHFFTKENITITKFDY